MSTNNTDILRKSTAILVGAGGGSGQQKIWRMEAMLFRLIYL